MCTHSSDCMFRIQINVLDTERERGHGEGEKKREGKKGGRKGQKEEERERRERLLIVTLLIGRGPNLHPG